MAKGKKKKRNEKKRKAAKKPKTKKFEPRLPFINNLLFGGPLAMKVKSILRRRR